MVILRTQKKITDFLMILAWASPFKYILVVHVFDCELKYLTTRINIRLTFSLSAYDPTSQTVAQQ